MPRETFLPFAATLLAIALLSLMDAYMKQASLVIGAYSALLLRYALAVAVVAPLWLARRERWPSARAMRFHVVRGLVSTAMAFTFFTALVHLPLADAIALSFISPLIALALAVLILKERVGRRAMGAAVMGLAGVIVIVAGRIGGGQTSPEANLGVVLVLLSAFLYAWNLILQRQQALLAKPLEIASVQGAVTVLVLATGAPVFLVLPTAGGWIDVTASAMLGLLGLLLLSWAYARAEAQALVPVEYTGFLWAALFGWLFFAEEVSTATLAGAVLIILGCWIAAPRKHTEQSVAGVT